MRHIFIVALLVLAFSVPGYSQQSNSISIRDILINQPDYIATETFTSAFMGHGFAVTYKTAKRMDCYRRQSETQITYSCLNQPNTIFFPKTREYLTEARPNGTGPDALFISDVQTFARTRRDVEYKLVGTEKIGELECLKIEAKVIYKEASPGFRDFTFVFYAAKNLNNLVISVDVTGNESYASSGLSDIRLDFPDRLFKRPEGYRETALISRMNIFDNSRGQVSLDYLIRVCCSDLTNQRPFRFTKVSVTRARIIWPFFNVSV